MVISFLFIFCSAFDLVFHFRFFKRCEEYFLCKYQPPDGINSVGQHIELEINIYLQRFPPQQRHIRRLVFGSIILSLISLT